MGWGMTEEEGQADIVQGLVQVLEEVCIGDGTQSASDD